MSLIKQGGGGSVPAGKVMTTMGLKDNSKRLCYGCGEKKEDDLFTIDGYGRAVCPDCAGSAGEGILRSDDSPKAG